MKKQKTKKQNTNKGITLIALVITIIVMLILVAVTISMAINGGLFQKASEAGQATNGAIANEQLLASGKVTIGNVTYNSIDEYINSVSGVNWTAILAEANANPNGYKHKEQLVSTYIGIGTDGEPVNMDYWNPTLLDDGTWVLGNSTNVYSPNNSYEGGYEGGTIKGKVPQYIYNTNTNTFKEVTKMIATFARSDIEIAPEIPNTVWNVYGLFVECIKLKQINHIPDSVSEIGYMCFCCTALETVKLPNGLKSIGEMAFTACESLTSIKIPNGLKSIEGWAFASCTGLTTVILPDSLTDIGSEAFASCTGLTTVILPDSLTDIGSAAFVKVPHITYNGTATGSPWGALSIN